MKPAKEIAQYIFDYYDAYPITYASKFDCAKNHASDMIKVLDDITLYGYDEPFTAEEIRDKINLYKEVLETIEEMEKECFG